MVKVKWKTLAASFLIIFLVAAVGIYFSGNSRSSWYDSLKPSLAPPNFVFPIVWTILFILIALSLYFAWVKNKQRNLVALAFAANLFINITWSIIFFYLKDPLLAFANIILMIISIVMMMYVVKDVDKKSFYLLIPYLLWVLFAAFLNYLIIRNIS